jgi:hypothetical protein
MKIQYLPTRGIARRRIRALFRRLAVWILRCAQDDEKKGKDDEKATFLPFVILEAEGFSEISAFFLILASLASVEVN